MSVVTLGLAGAVGHDPAAALFVDNKLVAAIEEERLIRRKHAKGELPYHSARQCLQIAGLRGADVTHIAIPYAPVSFFSKAFLVIGPIPLIESNAEYLFFLRIFFLDAVIANL